MRPRILWASPIPPIRSGVSDYAVELLAPLSRDAVVRVARPPDLLGDVALPPGIEVTLVSAETRPDEGEVSIAHIGNNPFHEWIVDRCSWDRTIVVVHDLVLHHLLVEHTLGKGDGGALERGLERAYPGAGRVLAEGRKHGFHGRLDPFLFPARESILDGAAGFLTHSRYGRILIEEHFPDRPVLDLKLPAADPMPVDRWEWRRRLGVADDECVLMHLGFPTREKGLGLVLAGFKAALKAGLNGRLIVVGEEQPDGAFEAAAAELGLADRVNVTGWLDWEQMIRIPAAADLGIALRVPSAGETSAAVLRFLACGTPTAVMGRKQFLEWPEAAAPRVTPGPCAAAEVARILLETQESGWDERRAAARQTYEDGHRPEDVAERIVDFISRFDARA